MKIFKIKSNNFLLLHNYVTNKHKLIFCGLKIFRIELDWISPISGKISTNIKNIIFQKEDEKSQQLNWEDTVSFNLKMFRSTVLLFCSNLSIFCTIVIHFSVMWERPKMTQSFILWMMQIFSRLPLRLWSNFEQFVWKCNVLVRLQPRKQYR